MKTTLEALHVLQSRERELQRTVPFPADVTVQYLIDPEGMQEKVSMILQLRAPMDVTSNDVIHELYNERGYKNIAYMLLYRTGNRPIAPIYF